MNGLRIGSRSCYNVHQLCDAINTLTQKSAKKNIDITYGDHEQLFDLLRQHELDAVITDLRCQKEKENFVYRQLETAPLSVAVPLHSPLTQQTHIEIAQLQKLTCILIAHKNYGEDEKNYYSRFLNFTGNFKITRDIPCAVTSVVHGHSFMPVISNTDAPTYYGQITKLLPLYNNGTPLQAEYGVFWNKGCLSGEQRLLLTELCQLMQIGDAQVDH